MAKVQVFENKPPILGINSLGRIGKLSLWHHIGRKYFKEIVVNLGREAGTGMDAVAQAIEKDTTYGLLHRFLYGIKSERLIQITDEKKEFLKQVTQNNIILEAQIRESKKRYDELRVTMDVNIAGMVVVQDKVFPGTKIVISNVVYFVREEIQHSKFIRDRADIKVVPLF